MTIRPATHTEWENFAAQAPGATFFHTPSWYRIWEQYDNYRPEPLLAEFDNGKTALLPLASIPRVKGLAKFYISSPAGTYGGWLSKETLLTDEQTALVSWRKVFPNYLIVGNPFLPVAELPSTRQTFTQVIDLCTGELALGSWSANHRRSLRAGIKTGIEIKMASYPEEWEEYYLLYQQSRQRWGHKASNNYGRKLFALIRRLPHAQCKLWLATFEGKNVAGCLCFYHRKQVVYWHGAAKTDAFYLHPHHVLHYHIMSDAVKSGCRTYDLGPSGGHDGVVRFKAGFGSRKLAFPVYEQENWLARTANYLLHVIPNR